MPLERPALLAHKASKVSPDHLDLKVTLVARVTVESLWLDHPVLPDNLDYEVHKVPLDMARTVVTVNEVKLVEQDRPVSLVHRAPWVILATVTRPLVTQLHVRVKLRVPVSRVPMVQTVKSVVLRSVLVTTTQIDFYWLILLVTSEWLSPSWRK